MPTANPTRLLHSLLNDGSFAARPLPVPSTPLTLKFGRPARLIDTDRRFNRLAPSRAVTERLEMLDVLEGWLSGAAAYEPTLEDLLRASIERVQASKTIPCPPSAELLSACEVAA